MLGLQACAIVLGFTLPLEWVKSINGTICHYCVKNFSGFPQVLGWRPESLQRWLAPSQPLKFNSHITFLRKPSLLLQTQVKSPVNTENKSPRGCLLGLVSYFFHFLLKWTWTTYLITLGLSCLLPDDKGTYPRGVVWELNEEYTKKPLGRICIVRIIPRESASS
jgi:hypothetical protein